ncbi:MAG: hypothetical protein KAS02_02030 [Candidatus Pacebacteria bacterium]|nr:hypothetical protein [Candidatus Paceibacterota bacterium]
MSKGSRRNKISLNKTLSKKERLKEAGAAIHSCENALLSARKQLEEADTSEFRSLRRLSQKVSLYEKNLSELRTQAL